MIIDYLRARDAGPDWRETLSIAMDPGLPDLFNIEWLIDKTERSEWSGLWW